MTHFMGRAVKLLLLSALTTLMLTAVASAAEGDLAIAVGCTTGSSLRMRTDASLSSDIVTMLEKDIAVAILDSSVEGWHKINHNGNIGYVSSDYLILDRDNLFTAYGRVNAPKVYVRGGPSSDSEALATIETDTIVTINGFQDGWYDVTCKYGTEGYIRSDLLDLTSAPASSVGKAIVETAKKHLGTRYVYGGSSSSGFDCSGFTMYVYRQFGHSLPHSATSQWQSGLGTRVYNASNLQPGDLVFFNDPSRNAGKACSHCGIYVGDGKFIHSSSSRSGGVIISDLTSGYYNRYFVGGIHI